MSVEEIAQAKREAEQLRDRVHYLEGIIADPEPDLEVVKMVEAVEDVPPAQWEIVALYQFLSEYLIERRDALREGGQFDGAAEAVVDLLLIQEKNDDWDTLQLVGSRHFS